LGTSASPSGIITFFQSADPLARFLYVRKSKDANPLPQLATLIWHPSVFGSKTQVRRAEFTLQCAFRMWHPSIIRSKTPPFSVCTVQTENHPHF
jgi:hypothetical protein